MATRSMGGLWPTPELAGAVHFGVNTAANGKRSRSRPVFKRLTKSPSDRMAMTPKVLPTMIPDEEEEPFVLHEIVDAVLTREQHQMLSEKGLTVIDILAGRVPEFDPVDIVIGVWDEHLRDEHPDEYARAMTQLPDLLGEYQGSGE